ncbi:MAG TPA: response regulator [Bacteroides sp.]|nr:response regulator [Bacteroides sp.]
MQLSIIFAPDSELCMENLRILVVDDIYTNRFLLSELIRMTGNEAVLAENGERAIEILKNEQIHLIFMDIEMPVMNGIETTQYIRKEMESPLSTIPIIALTAHNPEIFFEDFSDVGFDELITKPYSIEKIKEKIIALVP